MLKIAHSFDEARYPISVTFDATTRNPDPRLIDLTKLSIENHLKNSGVNDYYAFSNKGILTYHFKSEKDLAVAEEKIYQPGAQRKKVNITPTRSSADLILS